MAPAPERVALDLQRTLALPSSPVIARPEPSAEPIAEPSAERIAPAAAPRSRGVFMWMAVAVVLLALPAAAYLGWALHAPGDAALSPSAAAPASTETHDVALRPTEAPTDVATRSGGAGTPPSEATDAIAAPPEPSAVALALPEQAVPEAAVPEAAVPEPAVPEPASSQANSSPPVVGPSPRAESSPPRLERSPPPAREPRAAQTADSEPPNVVEAVTLAAEPPPADAAAEEARLRAVLAENPGDHSARASLAVLVAGRGEDAEADALLASLGEAEGGRVPRIDALVRLGRTADAQAALDALPDATRAQPSARMAAARLALAARRPDDAVRELTPLARSSGASAPLLALYARALLATGRVMAASEAYSASIERDASLPEALIGRAQMAVRSRRPTDAMRILNRIDTAALRPDLVTQIEFLRGRAQLMAEQRADARRTLGRVVERTGAPTQAYFFLAEAYAGHDYRAARQAYEAYLELEPSGYYARRARRALGR